MADGEVTGLADECSSFAKQSECLRGRGGRRPGKI